MPNYHRLHLPGHCYFFTLVTFERRPILASSQAVTLLMRTISTVKAKWPFEMIAHVVLPDHVHMLWQLPEDSGDFSTRMMLIKSNFSRSYSKVANPSEPRPPSRQRRREQTVWQRRFSEHAIRDQCDLDRHMDYIHFNPVHHGLVADAAQWPYSSYRTYYASGEQRRLNPSNLREMVAGEP